MEPASAPLPIGVAIVPATKIKLHPKRVWEAHRPVIKRLYIDEGLTLNGVIERMRRDLGFSATSKMYKTRLVQWNIVKNSKDSKQMLKPTLPCPKEAGSDWGRSKGRWRMPRINDGDLVSATDLTGWSPSPIADYVAAPDGLRGLESILHSTVGCSGASNTVFGTMFWAASEFLDHTRMIKRLMDDNRISRAGQFMRKAARRIEDVVRDPHSGTAVCALRAIMLTRSACPEVTALLLRHFADMARLYIRSSQHPVHRLLVHLEGIHPEDLQPTAVVAYECLLEALYQTRGHPELALMAWLLILILPAGADDFMSGNMGAGVQRLVLQHESRFGRGDPRTLDIASVRSVYDFRAAEALELAQPARLRLAGRVFAFIRDRNQPAVAGRGDGDGDAPLSVRPSPTVAERCIMGYAQECLALGDVQCALGFIDLARQWLAWRGDEERLDELEGWEAGACK